VPNPDDPDDPDGDDAVPSGGGGDAQAPRQAAAVSGDKLPFTGSSAILVLLMGGALVGGGIVLRRRTMSDL